MTVDTVRLAEVTFRIGSGITPRGGSAVYRHSGRPFVRSQNVGWGDLRLDDLAYIDEATHVTFPASEIRAGDVFLNITGASIGRSAVATSDLDGGNVNQHVCEIRLDRRRMNPYFVCAVLNSRIGQSQVDMFQAGGNRQGLNFQQIGSIRIPALALPEQNAVAEALGGAEELIATLEAQIAKKQSIKQGMMQQVLTGRTRLAGFSGEWEQVVLGDVARFSKGTGLPKSAVATNGSTLCIHYGELFTFYGPEIRTVASRTNPVGRAMTSEDLDVLMPTSDVTPRGLAKASAVHGRGIVLGGDILIIRADKSRAHGPFLARAIRRDANQVLQLVRGSTVYHLYAADMRNFAISLPPVDEQRRIADVLLDAEQEIAALGARLAKARDVKTGMMQQLLTGRVRLPAKVAA